VNVVTPVPVMGALSFRPPSILLSFHLSKHHTVQYKKRYKQKQQKKKKKSEEKKTMVAARSEMHHKCSYSTAPVLCFPVLTLFLEQRD